MFKVGITGGIGSGKSMVTKIFSVLGISTLDADAFAKKLMQENDAVKSALVKAFGNEIFIDGALQRKMLSQKVFGNAVALQQLNAIVHPAVSEQGRIWMEAQEAPYVVKEAALFFESNSAIEMDYMIGVYAPYEMCLQRAMLRDGVDESAIINRMKHQMDEEEKMNRCDVVIYNDETQSLLKQVMQLHQQILLKVSNL